MSSRLIEVPEGLKIDDVLRSLSKGPNQRHVDGTWFRGSHTPDGPGTIALTQDRQGVHVEGFGPGASWLVDRAEDLIGVHDTPEDFRPTSGLLRELFRKFGAPRIGRTHQVMEVLLRTIPGQRVTGKGAAQSVRDLFRMFGDEAPGPVDLTLAPSADRLASLSYAALHPAGLERNRAQTLIRCAQRARRIEQLGEKYPPEEAMRRLQSLPGVGPWTAGRVAEEAWGWPDAIMTGDYALPNTVTFALTGQARGDDAQMIALLEPYRPHRARVIRLLKRGHIKAPRFGPRTSVNNIRGR